VTGWCDADKYLGAKQLDAESKLNWSTMSKCYFPSTGMDKSGKLRLFSITDGRTKVASVRHFPSTGTDKSGVHRLPHFLEYKPGLEYRPGV